MSEPKKTNTFQSRYVYQTKAGEPNKSESGGYGAGDASLDEDGNDTGVRRRRISKADYDTILASLEKSKASDKTLGAYLHFQGMADADVKALLEERKKKSTGFDSSVSTGYLQFPETEKLLAGDAKGNIKRTQQGIQYDIQKNEDNKRVIEGASYNSFLDFQESKADILGDSEYDTPNDMFEILVDKDNEYLKDIEPFQNLINRVDLDIAEELGVKDAYESGMKSRSTKRGLEESWAPFSGATASRIKLSKEQVSAIQAVNNAIKERGIPFASEYDTDDPVQKVSEIRDEYRSKYGAEFSQIFQEKFKSAIPPRYAEDQFFLKKVEDYMHMQNSSVDLNGDGRIYQRGTALGRGYNQSVLSVFEMVADVGMVIADQVGDGDFKKAVVETKKQIANKKELEGKVEYNDFSLSDFLEGKEGTVTGLVNKTIGLTAQSLPYMVGVGAIQKGAAKKGLSLLGSKSLAKYTASTVGMGTISAASAYSNGMGQDWFEEMSLAGKIGYSGIHGLAEGAGETVSFAVFNKMIAPMFKLGKEATKKSITQFVMGGVKSYGFQVTEEMAAESSTALVQTVTELIAKGEDITWEKLDDRVYEAIEGAILMTGGMKIGTGAIRAPFEVQNLHISSKLGIGDQKLRSRAVIKQLSEEYEKTKDAKAKGVIGAQLAKALQQEAQRNKDNAAFFEFVREKSPEDHAQLLEIADSFQEKVDQWNSMEDGAAKSSLGAEIKSDFQNKLDIESKYSEAAAEITNKGKFKAPDGSSKEAASIAEKIFQGEQLTLEEEAFYAENQAEVEGVVNATTEAPLFTPFAVDSEKPAPTVEVQDKDGSSIIDNLVNHFETLGEDVFSGYKTTKENAIKGLVSIKNAVQAIKKVNPDAKVFIHTTGKAFKDATGLSKLSRGYYTTGNEVHLLAPAMVSTTGYHESVHAAFMDVLGNKAYNALFGEISKMVRNSGGMGSAVGSVIQNFVEGYNIKDRSEEGVTEFIAMLAEGKFDIEIEKGILRKIAESIGNALGFKVPVPSRTQAVQIMKDVAASLRDGTPIDPEKIDKLSKRKDKPTVKKGKAQRVLDPRQIEEGDPVYDYLMGLDIVPEDLEWMGSGDFGEAYSDGDGTIVKFTNSNNEFETAQEILAVTGGRKKLIDLAFAEIEDAVEIDGNKIIIMEELDTDGAEELYYELDGMASDAGVPLSEFWIDADEVTEVDGDLIEGLDHLDDIFRAYRALGIFAPDVKGDNLGFGKDGRLKAFDIQERGKSQIIEDIENQVIDTYSEPQSSKLSEQKGKAQAIVMDKASNLIKRNIIDPRTLVGEDIPMALFYDNTRVGESTVKNTIDGYTTKNSFNGGFGYSFRDNAPFQYNGKTMTPVIAVSTEQKASSIIKEMLSKKGNLIPLVTQNNLTGHLGNLDTLEELFGESGHFNHAAKKSPEAMDSIVAGLKSAVQSAVDFAGTSTVKADLKKALSKVNLDEINTVNEFREVVLKGAINSFGRRNAFFKEYLLLKKRGKKATKSTTQARALAYEHGIPTMQELADGITEQAFSNTELGDVVAFIRPERKAVIYTDLEEFKNKGKRKNNKGFEYEVIYAPDLSKHSSYPFVIVGENVGFPSSYIDVTSIFPDLEGISKKTSYYGAGRRADNAPTGTIKAELAALPNTSEVNQFYKLSASPEGKSQIIGEIGAQAADRYIEKLLLAKEMEASGKSVESVFNATGWYRGLDNQWRHEVTYGNIKKSFLNSLEPNKKYKLTDVMELRGLLDMYPVLREYSFVLENMRESWGGYHQKSGKVIAINQKFYFDGVDGRTIMKVKKGSFAGLMNTIYHEIQHAVQSEEGISDGYNEVMVSYDASYSRKRGYESAQKQYDASIEILNYLFEKGDSPFFEAYGEWEANIYDKYFPRRDFTFKKSTSKRLNRVINSEGADLRMELEDFLGILDISDDDAKSIQRFVKKWAVEHREVVSFSDFIDKKLKDISPDEYIYTSQRIKPNVNGVRDLRDRLNRIAKGASMNVARYKKLKWVPGTGEFEIISKKIDNYQVYLRNLGEAEARLAGKRGTMKNKNKKALIHDMFPDIHKDFIWQVPPSSFYKPISEERQKIQQANYEKSDALDIIDEKKKQEKISEQQEIIDSSKKKIEIFESKLKDGFAKYKKGKSQLIEGTQEFDLFKKDVQEQMIKAGVDGFVESNTGVNRLFEQLRYKFADKYQPLQNLQKSIEKATGDVLRSDANFRRAEALMHGKAANDARLFEENMLKPLMDKMVEYGVTNEQLSEYLYSLHAYERNEFVKNTIDPANEQGSGMSNEVAEAIKSKYADQKDVMDELAKDVYAITEASRKTMLEAGLINKAQYDSFKMFENYIPLVGTAVTPTSDLFDFTDSRTSSDLKRSGGISIFGKEYKQVTGRFSEAQSPLETVVSSFTNSAALSTSTPFLRAAI